MEVTTDEKCFVCGLDNAAGLQAHFAVDKEQRRAVCTIRLAATYQGWRGMVHGGILAALVDEAGIYACRSVGEHFVTAELQVKYKAPVPIDQYLLVTGEVVESRRRIYSIKAKIELEGQLLVEATAKILEINSA